MKEWICLNPAIIRLNLTAIQITGSLGDPIFSVGRSGTIDSLPIRADITPEKSYDTINQ